MDIIFPSLGAILTNIFGLNILRSYIINRDELVYEYNDILFYLLIFNGYMWLLYSVIIKDIFIYLSCITSIVSSFGFIQIIYRYIKPVNKIYIEILCFCGLLFILLIIFLLNFTEINIYIIQQIIGTSCTIITILCNMAPLLVIRQVIKTRNTELIYLPQIFINSINYLCWFIYAILKYNIFLLIPNLISFILCLFQIIIYVFIKNTNNKIQPNILIISN